MKTLEEYIEFYEKHTGERFEFKQPFSFYYHPAHGFCEYHSDGNSLYIWQLCGDLKFWVDIAYRACKIFGLKSMATYIIRKPKPFMRALGFHIVSAENRGGYISYTAKNKAGEIMTARQFGDRFILVWKVGVNNE